MARALKCAPDLFKYLFSERAEKHAHLAQGMANDPETLSVCQLALVLAANSLTFDSKRSKFENYARRSMANLRGREAERASKRRMAHIPERFDPPAKDSVIADVIAHDIWNRAGEMLPKKWFRVIRLHYEKGLTFTEIAERMDVSRERVKAMHDIALERMRDAAR